MPVFLVFVVMALVVTVFAIHGKGKAAEEQRQTKQKRNTQFVHMGSFKF
jgi:uncharacterized membrane protein